MHSFLERADRKTETRPPLHNLWALKKPLYLVPLSLHIIKKYYRPPHPLHWLMALNPFKNPWPRQKPWSWPFPFDKSTPSPQMISLLNKAHIPLQSHFWVLAFPEMLLNLGLDDKFWWASIHVAESLGIPRQSDLLWQCQGSSVIGHSSMPGFTSLFAELEPWMTWISSSGLVGLERKPEGKGPQLLRLFVSWGNSGLIPNCS